MSENSTEQTTHTDPNQVIQTSSEVPGYGEYTAEQYQQYYQYYQQQYDYSQYYQPGMTEGQPPQPQSGEGQGFPQGTEDMSQYYAQYYGFPNQGYAYGGYPPRPPIPTGQEPTRSVWLGNIHSDVTEAELHSSFSTFGNVESIKLLPTKNCAFIRFVELDAAIQAHSAMQGASIHGQQIKLGWGKAEPTQKDEAGPPPCRNLWLGNITPDVTEEQIRHAFGRFGVIDKIRILPAKNCAFVNFISLDAAIQAKTQMQGAVLGDKPIRINYGKELSEGSIFGEVAPNPVSLIPKPPPEQPPPEDQKEKSLIDKSAEFVARNGATFEDVMMEKQKDNPKFGFLFEDHPHYGYYKWKLWKLRYPDIDPETYFAEKPVAPPPGPYAAVPPPSSLSSPNQTSYGFSSPQPPEDTADTDVSKLSQLLENLVPTKDSIKVVKSWIMQRPKQAKEISKYIRSRVEILQDFEQRLNILYLIHDILHHSARSRNKSETSDEYSEAFLPVLPTILRLTYQDQSQDNQDKVLKVIRIWEDKSIYDTNTLRKFEDEMKTQKKISEESKSHRSSSSHRSDSWNESRDRERDYDRNERDRDSGRKRGRERDYDRDDRSDHKYEKSRRH